MMTIIVIMSGIMRLFLIRSPPPPPRADSTCLKPQRPRAAHDSLTPRPSRALLSAARAALRSAARGFLCAAWSVGQSCSGYRNRFTCWLLSAESTEECLEGKAISIYCLSISIYLSTCVHVPYSYTAPIHFSGNKVTLTF